MVANRIRNVPAVVGTESDPVLYRSGAAVPLVGIEDLDGVGLDVPLMTKVLMPGPKASLLEYRLSEGQDVPPLHFAHEFVAFLVEGRMSVTLAGTSYDAVERDAWAAAPGVSVAMRALTDCVLVELMTPPHLQVKSRLITWGTPVPCSSHIFTRWADAEEHRISQVEGTRTWFATAPPEGLDEVRNHLKLLIPGPNIAMIWSQSAAGKRAFHTHGHNFVYYLVKGRVKEMFGGKTYEVEARDIWAAPAGVIHYTESLTDREGIEIKWPAPLILEGVISSWEGPTPQPD